MHLVPGSGSWKPSSKQCHASVEFGGICALPAGPPDRSAAGLRQVQCIVFAQCQAEIPVTVTGARRRETWSNDSAAELALVSALRRVPTPALVVSTAVGRGMYSLGEAVRERFDAGD